MTVQGNLGVDRMCQLAQVSRASFYRTLKERAPAEEDLEVRSAIQQACWSTAADMAQGASRPRCAGVE